MSRPTTTTLAPNGRQRRRHWRPFLDDTSDPSPKRREGPPLSMQMKVGYPGRDH